MPNEWLPENPHESGVFSSAHGFFIANPEHEAFADGCQQAAKGIVEWLHETCDEHYANGDKNRELLRVCCPKCLENLRKEVLGK